MFTRIKRLQNTSIEICICTFPVCRCEEHPKDYLVLSNEIMLPFGTGIKNTIPKRYLEEVKGFPNSL
jgi:hypothetical protein